MPKMTLIVAKFSLEHLATPGPSLVSLLITEPGSAGLVCLVARGRQGGGGSVVFQ